MIAAAQYGNVCHWIAMPQSTLQKKLVIQSAILSIQQRVVAAMNTSVMQKSLRKGKMLALTMINVENAR